MEATIEFRGETYKSSSEFEKYSCSGCEFHRTTNCDDVCDKSDRYCTTYNVIWIKQPAQQKEAEVQPTKPAGQPKYTVEDIIGYCLEYLGESKIVIPGALIYVNKKLAQKQDPDYQKIP